MRDSGLISEFNLFFNKQDKDAYKKLKDHYVEFIIKNTPINGKKETRRIFTKVINPLAYKQNKKGSKRGRISKQKITFDELFYNRPNWRDIGKNKDITRNEYNKQNKISYEKFTEYKIQKAKNKLRLFNEKFRNNKSEVEENGEYPDNAIHIHHIFPKAEFPEISFYLENLIALTPNQHYCLAHPNGNTNEINKEFQYICILYKIQQIKENIKSIQVERIYEFKDMTHVLDIGYKTDEFEKIEEMDFDKVFKLIEKYK